MAALSIQQTFELASQHHRAGRLPEAEQLYRQILATQPNHVEALHYLGVLAHQTGRTAIAVDLIQRSIALKPDWPKAYDNLGNIFRESGRLREAIAAYGQAVMGDTNLPETQNNLGIALGMTGQLDEAVTAFRRAIALRPNFAEAHDNLGNALYENGRFAEAVAAYRLAIRVSPQNAMAHSNLGVALKELGLLEEGITGCRQAIAVRRDLPDAHFNLALMLLQKGDFALGWKEHEWRWLCKDRSQFRLELSQPQWDGSDLTNRSILLYSEQGFGDSIQFSRYIPLVAARGGEVILGCPPPLQPLLQNIPGVKRLLVWGEPLPMSDFHCPLLSLPLVFGTTLQSIPGSVPYLHADSERAEQWRKKLAGDGSGLKVGLAWAGRANPKGRSIPPRSLLRLSQVQGATFYSLQKLESDLPHGLDLIDRTEDLKDFADTAALIANLDLVISIDSAVAHLAGAMGKPVWTLLKFMPDWRWMLDRDDSPWYPTMRLFRQPCIGDWESVIRDVTLALAEFPGLSG